MRIYPLIFDSMLISKFQEVFSPPTFRNAEKRRLLLIYAVLCPFKYSFGSDLLLLVVSIANACFCYKTYNAKETIGNVLTDRQMDITFAFVLILTISMHCFGHLMRTVICLCVFLCTVYFSSAFLLIFNA